MSTQTDGIHDLESILRSPAIIKSFVIVYAYDMAYLCLETFVAVASAHEPRVSGNIVKNVTASIHEKTAAI